MNLMHFLNSVSYSRECPERIDPNMWAGMLVWYDMRTTLGEVWQFEDAPDDERDLHPFQTYNDQTN